MAVDMASHDRKESPGPIGIARKQHSKTSPFWTGTCPASSSSYTVSMVFVNIALHFSHGSLKPKPEQGPAAHLI